MKQYFLVLAAILAITPASAAQQQAQHDHEHGAASASAAAPEKPAVSGAEKSASAAEGKMDMKAMCDMHKDMMSSKSKRGHEAKPDDKTKRMSAAEREKQMKMMDEHCK